MEKFHPPRWRGRAGPDIVRRVDPPESPIRASVLASLGDRAGFTTRELGDTWTVPGVTRLFGLRQVHSDRVIRVGAGDDPSAVRSTEADGLVTSDPGVALVIRVADCVPVLVATPDGRAVAALHAGWRSIAASILGRGIDLVCETAGCDPGDLVAAAGPAIGPCCYEVDIETGRRIASPAPGGVLSEPYGEGKVKADLWQAVLGQLDASGLKSGNTEAIRTCTRCHPELFHSYRRDGPRAGRQIGFIATPAR